MRYPSCVFLFSGILFLVTGLHAQTVSIPPEEAGYVKRSTYYYQHSYKVNMAHVGLNRWYDATNFVYRNSHFEIVLEFQLPDTTTLTSRSITTSNVSARLNYLNATYLVDGSGTMSVNLFDLNDTTEDGQVRRMIFTM